MAKVQSPRWLEPLVRKCIALMGVDNYAITVQWVAPEELEETHNFPASGDCQADAQYLQALIRLSNDLTRENARHTIPHELSHVRHANVERLIESLWKAKPRPRWSQVKQIIHDEFEKIAQADAELVKKIVR